MSQQPQQQDGLVEFIGMIQGQKVSEIHPAKGPALDRDYVRAFAQAHEAAGFDRVLVPHHSTSPDATLTVAYAASVTERIHFMLAHRPGFVAPTLAARQFASLDQFSGGRRRRDEAGTVREHEVDALGDRGRDRKSVV